MYHDHVNAPSPAYDLIDHAGLGSLLFYPRPDPSTPPKGALDLAFEVAPGVRLGARFYPFDRAWPTILYFHGNGEVAGDHNSIAPFYGQIGVNLLVCEFRGYGRSSGQPTFATLVADGGPAAVSFHDFLDANGFAPSRFVMGRSLGANPALEVAANHATRFQGFILESGAGNIRRLAGRAGLDVEDGDGLALVEAHEAKLRSIRLPGLLIHGDQDELIPVSTAIELNAILEATECDLIVIPGAGHNDILWVGNALYFAAIRTFVEKHVLASEAAK